MRADRRKNLLPRVTGVSRKTVRGLSIKGRVTIPNEIHFSDRTDGQTRPADGILHIVIKDSEGSRNQDKHGRPYVLSITRPEIF